MAGSASLPAGAPEAGSGPDWLRHWQAVRDAGDIQYAPLPPIKPPPPSAPPEWLGALGRFLEHLLAPVAQGLGASWPFVRMLGAAAGALLVLALAWYVLRQVIRKYPKRGKAAKADWLPAAADAQALLADADLLAGDGRYDEAAHLLLRRSVQHIAEARPDWLHPASTAREIALLPALSASARDSFATIVALVERSRYAMRPLALSDWQQARQAYTGFAMARITPA